MPSKAAACKVKPRLLKLRVMRRREIVGDDILVVGCLVVSYGSVRCSLSLLKVQIAGATMQVMMLLTEKSAREPAEMLFEE